MITLENLPLFFIDFLVLVFYMKASRLKYRGLHRFFCRFSSVAVLFVAFTFCQIFQKLFGMKFRNFKCLCILLLWEINSLNLCFYYPKSTPKIFGPDWSKIGRRPTVWSESKWIFGRNPSQKLFWLIFYRFRWSLTLSNRNRWISTETN
jgi:hypothetical protein